MRVTVNGRAFEEEVEPRTLLSDFIRHRCRLTATHVGCEQGVCGACTVLLDGEPVRSCLLFAVQVDGHELTTVEALPDDDLRRAFNEHHALQCGFCTAGFLISAHAMLAAQPHPTEREIREQLAGNLCRCTGYEGIVDAIVAVGRQRSGAARGVACRASESSTVLRSEVTSRSSDSEPPAVK
jgi:aerobic-type carbon monoxide dehydrogenase small subunit (CoxS/CutS family)